MNGLKESSKTGLLRNRFVIANYFLICLMISSLAVSFQQLIHVFSTDWNGNYLPFVGFCIGLIALRSRKATKDLAFLSIERTLRVLFEWTLILIILKILIYLINDPSQFLVEIWLWDDNFFKYFFTSDYIIAVVSAIVFWVIARTLGDPIDQLEEDKELLDQEKLGFTVSDRTKARKRMIGSVFTLGGIQLIITTLLISEIPSLPFTEIPETRLLAGLVLFFLFGFLMIALNQYNLQKARWYLSDVIVSDFVGKRWFISCVTLVFCIFIIAIFLPTRYILGFFPAVRQLFNYLAYIYNLLISLIFLPFVALLKLFGKPTLDASSKEEIGQTTPQSFQQPSLVPISAELPWWSLAKSLIFWSIFIFLIFFALRYYFGQRKEFFQFLRKITISKWLKNFSHIFIDFFKKVRKFASTSITKGAKILHSYFIRTKTQAIEIPRLFSHLPPRLGIIMLYLDLRSWLDKHKYPIRNTLTPNEFANHLSTLNPVTSGKVQINVSCFTEARYTKHRITKTDYKQTQEAINQLKTDLLAINQ
jgi:hypothetical protein